MSRRQNILMAKGIRFKLGGYRIVINALLTIVHRSHHEARVQVEGQGQGSPMLLHSAVGQERGVDRLG